MPDWTSLVRDQLRGLSADPAREAEIIQEIADHLEDRYGRAAAGLSREAAMELVRSELGEARAARRDFLRADRPSPAAPTPPPMEQAWFRSVFQDLLYAFRVLWRQPSFSLFVIFVLGVGITAGTSVFTVVNAVLLRPLPYPEPDRLTLVGHGTNTSRPGTVGFATFEDWTRESESFSRLAALRSWWPTLQEEERARRLTGLRVSASYFSLLGVQPAIGRDFEPQEDRPDRGKVVILSDALWRERFGGDPEAVGRSITLNGRGYEIVGVLPGNYRDIPSAHLYQAAEIWAPLAYDASLPWACRSCQHLRAMGRLRPGVSRTSAAGELDSILTQMRKQHPTEYAEDARAVVTGLQDHVTRPLRPALRILGAAVFLVLLISCANVTNLLFARGVRRRKEISLRSALGAGRRRLLRQVFTENLLLGATAGLVGVVLTQVVVRTLLATAPEELLRLGPIEVDFTILLFAPLLSILTALLAGVAPAFGLMRGNLTALLRQDSRLTATPGVRRAQRALVVADLALATVLLAASLLMLQSVRHLIAVSPGFDPEDLLTFRISMVGEAYEDDDAVWTATKEILGRLEAIPGVAGVAAASQAPQGANWDSWGIHREDQLESNPAEAPSAQLYVVTPGYFDVMGIPLVRGRLFDRTDRAGSLPVLLVGKETATQFWPGRDPLGQRVRVGGSKDGPWWTVVGIVGEVLHKGLDANPGPQIYLPLAQRPHPFPTLIIKVESHRGGLQAQVESAVAATRRDVPVYAFATMQEYLDTATADRRFVTFLLAAFAMAAVLLSAAGVYGLASYFVQQHTHELAVRMALGAGLAQVSSQLLGRGARLTLVGIACGLLLTIGAARYMEALLFRIQPLDPLTLAACGALLVLVVAAAHLLPLRRAFGIPPSRALKAE